MFKNYFCMEKLSKEKMVKKCIYCGGEVHDDSVIDFCRRCGVGVFGEKMFNAIVQNMEDARERGDLVYTDSPRKKEERKE